MKIQEAQEKDIENLMRFYNDMCEVLDKKDFLPNGDKGGFPSHDMVVSAINEHAQFIGTEDGKIIAAYILNHDCDPAYQTAHWRADALPHQVLILHALRVLPQYGGRGHSKELVEHAIQTARDMGQKALRLDVLEGNVVPERMYTSFGFQYIDTVDIRYEDIGEPMRFRLMELVL